MVSLKQAQDDYNAMEQQLLKDKKELKEQIHDLELAHLEQVRQLKIVSIFSGNKRILLFLRDTQEYFLNQI